MQQILPKNTGKDRKKIVFFHVLIYTIRFPGHGNEEKGRDNYTAGTDGVREKNRYDILKNNRFRRCPVAD